IAEPGLHDRGKVSGAARLRSHLGRDLDRDLRRARGTRVYVHAIARDGEWILVEAPTGQVGWVRHCEIAVVARQGAAGDDVVVTRAGYVRSTSGGTGPKIASLSPGLRLKVEDRDKDSVRLTLDDGMTGWF